MPKSLASLLPPRGGSKADDQTRPLGGGPLIEAGIRTSPGAVPGPQIGSEPLGAQTGAPPRTRMSTMQVGPTTVQIVPADPASRVIVLTAPLVGFTIFVGDAGVQTNGGLALPRGLPYEFVLPGMQELFAITDAPVFLPVVIQAAAILVGDRQRRYG